MHNYHVTHTISGDFDGLWHRHSKTLRRIESTMTLRHSPPTVKEIYGNDPSRGRGTRTRPEKTGPNPPIDKRGARCDGQLSPSVKLSVHHLLFTVVTAVRVRALPETRCRPSVGEGRIWQPRTCVLKVQLEVAKPRWHLVRGEVCDILNEFWDV